MSKGYFIYQAESGAIRQGPAAPPHLEERPATAEWAMSQADNDLGLYDWIMRREWLEDDFETGAVSVGDYDKNSSWLDHKIESYDIPKHIEPILGDLALREPPKPTTRSERKRKK